jgi:hypothetical protein
MWGAGMMTGKARRREEMKSTFAKGKNGVTLLRHRWMTIMFIAVLVLLFAGPSKALDPIEVSGKPLTISGYINQGIGWGIGGDEYDTKEGFQSAVFQLLLEGLYKPRGDLRLFASGMFNADWAYPILNDKGEWERKGFNQSRSELYMLNDFNDVLKEFHVTWTPGNFLFRAGKQIVAWGETDGFRLMDQINPLDQRRGFTDVEFESTILPIWLVRAEYWPQVQSTWMQDLGFEFVFNPNADFRGDEGIVPGNDVAGIWAPDARVPLGGPYPFDYAHVGSMDANIHEPDNWNSDGFEYAFRVKTTVGKSFITLNYFYGLDNVPVQRVVGLPRMEMSPFDARMIMHLPTEGYYPRFRFAGATFTRDFENLNVSSLGGVAPLLRLEAFYAFDSTFVTSMQTFEKSDELRWAIGVDWKIKVNWLNPRAYITIMPQFYNRRIMDYPSNYKLSGSEEDNWMSTLLISTSYFHNKLTPQFFWMRDITNKADMFLPSLKWEQSHKWNYTLGAVFFAGSEEGSGFQVFENKNQVYLTIAYRF